MSKEPGAPSCTPDSRLQQTQDFHLNRFKPIQNDRFQQQREWFWRDRNHLLTPTLASLTILNRCWTCSSTFIGKVLFRNYLEASKTLIAHIWMLKNTLIFLPERVDIERRAAKGRHHWFVSLRTCYWCLRWLESFLLPHVDTSRWYILKSVIPHGDQFVSGWSAFHALESGYRTVIVEDASRGIFSQVLLTFVLFFLFAIFVTTLLIFSVPLPQYPEKAPLLAPHSGALVCECFSDPIHPSRHIALCVPIKSYECS